MPTDDSVDWMPVIGRALSFLCMHQGGVADSTMVEKADFLLQLGLPRKEAAQLLGTSDHSLSVMYSQRAAKVKKVAKKTAPAKKAAKSNGK